MAFFAIKDFDKNKLRNELELIDNLPIPEMPILKAPESSTAQDEFSF